MPTPIAQELRELITFRDTAGPTTIAGVSAETTTIATAYARITEGGGAGAEDEDMQHQGQTQSFEVWTQWIPNITSFLQIEWGSRTLVIVETPQKIVDRFGRQWLLIHVEETIERSL